MSQSTIVQEDGSIAPLGAPAAAGDVIFVEEHPEVPAEKPVKINYRAGETFPQKSYTDAQIKQGEWIVKQLQISITTLGDTRKGVMNHLKTLKTYGYDHLSQIDAEWKARLDLGNRLIVAANDVICSYNEEQVQKAFADEDSESDDEMGY